MLNIVKQGHVVEVHVEGRRERNLLTWEVIKALRDCALELQHDTEVRVVLLTGKPDMFTGGFDLETAVDAIQQTDSLNDLRMLNRYGREMCDAWENLRPFTICAVEGYCVGGGAALAISCDIRVAARNALFFVPEIYRAMNLGWGAVPRLVNLIGPARAKEVCILAEKVPAESALALGLIERIAEPGCSMAMARALAVEIAQRPPVAVHMIKRSINAYANALMDVATFADGDQFLLLSKSSDGQEGVDSFLEKRPAVFTGR